MQAAAGLSYAAHSHHHSPINQSAAAAAAMNPYAASSTLLASQVKIAYKKIRQIDYVYKVNANKSIVLTSFFTKNIKHKITQKICQIYLVY